MSNRNLYILSGIAIAAMLVSARIVGGMLPDGTLLPVHWSVDGKPNGFADKWTALCLPPLLTLLLTLVAVAANRVEPMQASLAKSRGLLHVVWIGLVGLMGVIQLMVVGAALHWTVPRGRVLVGALGLFFMLLGNQLGKSRRMYFVGIRTPWTLANEDVWIATHRLGGKLMVLAGLVWALAAAANWVNLLTFPILILAMGIASLVPVVYSYLLWRRLPRDPAA